MRIDARGVFEYNSAAFHFRLVHCGRSGRKAKTESLRSNCCSKAPAKARGRSRAATARGCASAFPDFEARMNFFETGSDKALSNRDPRWQWVDVPEIVDQVCRSLAERADKQGVDTVTDVPCHLPILADREMLAAALTQLMTNALDAMPGGGRMVITSYFGPGRFELEVADTGVGLSDHVRSRVFEPHFTTKAGKAGMGLALVKRIAKALGGDVVAMNCPEGGAAFTLRLPKRAYATAA
jgi:signal transduction histidine kinase